LVIAASGGASLVIRLYVEAPFSEGGAIDTGPEQTHYLAHVMRARTGDAVQLFNGRDGEWRAVVADVSRRKVWLRLEAQARPQATGPDLDLIVAVVKRPRLETIIEKAAELGARRIQPVTTERTNAGHANGARLRAIAIEAAEQTGRLDVPEILPEARLVDVLAAWPSERRLMFCDEAGEAAPVREGLAGHSAGPWAILIGPEGGFSPAERAAARAILSATPVNLGPRILRADTAAIAALTLWQASLGDWMGAGAGLEVR
jgi:16S rRNA (uracil1498-N3)-methyltransferase